MIDSITLIAGNTKSERITSYILWSLLVIALIGSILSAFGICTGGCTDAEKYRLFGLRFSTVGIPFFIVATIASFLRNSGEPKGWYVFDVMIAGATGAEYLFFYIQKHLIGHYCPICLFIAAAVTAAAVLRLGEVILRMMTNTAFPRFKCCMGALAYAVFMIFVGFSGLTLAVAATSDSTASTVSSSKLNQDIWIDGPPVPKVEIYFVTDWFCNYCKKAEPAIEAMLPAVSKEARYTFIDRPLLNQSLNFMPFHASLLLKDKKNYIQGRNILQQLADKKQTPTEETVKAAFAQRGLTFLMADYATVMELSNSVAGFLRKSGVVMTPSIVVRNSITGEQQVLAGIENIKEQIVLDTIKKMQR